jgi:hypothetical protein
MHFSSPSSPGYSSTEWAEKSLVCYNGPGILNFDILGYSHPVPSLVRNAG